MKKLIAVKHIMDVFKDMFNTSDSNVVVKKYNIQKKTYDDLKNKRKLNTKEKKVENYDIMTVKGARKLMEN